MVKLCAIVREEREFSRLTTVETSTKNYGWIGAFTYTDVRFQQMGQRNVGPGRLTKVKRTSISDGWRVICHRRGGVGGRGCG